jgi:hypothetical protein
MKTDVVWDVKSCILVDSSNDSEQPNLSILYPEDTGSTFLLNVCK